LDLSPHLHEPARRQPHHQSGRLVMESPYRLRYTAGQQVGHVQVFGAFLGYYDIDIMVVPKGGRTHDHILQLRLQMFSQLARVVLRIELIVTTPIRIEPIGTESDFYPDHVVLDTQSGHVDGGTSPYRHHAAAILNKSFPAGSAMP
jgi:hypothetical protein